MAYGREGKGSLFLQFLKGASLIVVIGIFVRVRDRVEQIELAGSRPSGPFA